MTRNDKRDIALIGASLCGVVAGAILDELRRGDKPGDAGSEGEHDPLISLPALMTATTLSRKLGERAGLPEESVLRQALVAFATGMLLTYFAEAARSYLPGLR